MAKLSARGRTEVMRATKQVAQTNGDQKTYTRAFMSDGTCLQKFKIEAKDGFKHDYGFKVFGTWNDVGHSIEDCKALYQKKGWTIETK